MTKTKYVIPSTHKAKKLLQEISAFEETAILALESDSLPPEAGMVATVLKQCRTITWDLWELMEDIENKIGKELEGWKTELEKRKK